MKRITLEETKIIMSFRGIDEDKMTPEAVQTVHKHINTDLKDYDPKILSLLESFKSKDRNTYLALVTMWVDIHYQASAGEIESHNVQNVMNAYYMILKRMTPTAIKQLWQHVFDKEKSKGSPVRAFQNILYYCVITRKTPTGVVNGKIISISWEFEDDWAKDESDMKTCHLPNPPKGVVYDEKRLLAHYKFMKEEEKQ